jgi:hypothetical protein
MTTPQQPDSSPLPPGGVRLAFGLLMLLAPVALSLANGFLASRPGTPTALALVTYLLVGATCLASWRCAATSDRRMLALALGLLLVQAIVLLWAVPPGPWPPHRMLRASSLIGTVATLLVAGLVFARVARPALAMTAVMAVAGLLVFGEAASGIILHGPDPEFVSEVRADSLRAAGLMRDTTITEYFADDPDQYLDPVDVRADHWQLSVQPGNEATLVLPPDRPGELRVLIAQADTGPTWHIQLAQPRIPVEPRQGYTLAFRYRADAPRPIGVGFVQAHEPWEMIGFYRQIAATTEWQDFVQRFTVEEADSNTRISLDLAGRAVGVTFADVSLTDDLGVTVEPPRSSDRFFVRYRFNNAGCRDDDPATGDSSAVLILGGTGVLGQELHQRHTLADQLQHPDSALRAALPGHAQGVGPVLNCAMRGADTEAIARALPALLDTTRPRAVVLAFSRDDLRRIHHHEQREWLGGAPAVCRVLSLCAQVLMPRPGESRLILQAIGVAVAGIRDAVRARGASFHVVLMQTDGDPGWQALATALRDALGDDRSAVQSAAPALVDSLPTEVLQVTGRDLPNALAHRLTAAHLLPTLAPAPPP